MASIAKRPDGRWRARYRDPTGREHARHFARKVDAQRWLDSVTAALTTGNYVDPALGRVTFAGFYRDWAARQLWTTGTRRAMDLAAGSVPFGNVALASIRRSQLEAWVKTMTATLAPATVRTRYANVRTVLRAAVRDGLIAKDPAEGVTLPRERRREASMRIPTPDEVRAIIGAADPKFRTLVAVCAFAGLRLGEAAALQVGDVDFLRRTLRVSRQVQRETGGGVEIRGPKHGSERIVYLPDALVAILARHVELHVPLDSPWLFRGEVSQPPHQNTVGYWWRKACREAGIPDLRLHDLRHFYASGLISQGCDVVTVQRALGHASAKVTLDTYAHLWPSAADRTRSAAAGIMAEVAGPQWSATRAQRPTLQDHAD